MANTPGDLRSGSTTNHNEGDHPTRYLELTSIDDH